MIYAGTNWPADFRGRLFTLNFHGRRANQEVLERGIRVMDSTAITLCMEHDVPILVFNFLKEGNIQRAVTGDQLGTRIGSAESKSTS